MNRQKNIILSTLAALALLLLSCNTPITEEPEGFVEKQPEEVVFTHAEVAYMGDYAGDSKVDGWMLRLYSTVEHNEEGALVGPGVVTQILLNSPHNPQQEAEISLLRGIYTAQKSSADFSPGSFINGYIHYVDLPNEKIELPEATYWAEIEEGSTEMDIDIVDDGAVQISGSGNHFVVEGTLVGPKCLKHKFSWSGTLEPTEYVESEVPNSTLKGDLTLGGLSHLWILDRGDYFVLRDESCRSLLVFLTDEGVTVKGEEPSGTGRLLRLELLVPWSWDATQGLPEGTYPMLTRNADTSIDRVALTPYHSVPGLPNRFVNPYWAGAWYVEYAEGEWSEYARIKSGGVTIVRGANGSHTISCTLQDSTPSPYQIEAEATFDRFTTL